MQKNKYGRAPDCDKENIFMRTKMFGRKVLTVLLILCMVLSLAPILAFAKDSTVSNEAELKSALENADCSEIKLGGNIETAEELDVERTVTLDLNGYTLSCSSTGEDIFRVSSSGNLTIKDSSTGGKIDGQNKNCGFNVRGGTMILESGSIVNCKTDGDGAAVDVSNTGVTETPIKYGKFIMNGGAIMDCKADDDAGAVDIGSGCTFIMNGGTIAGCRADDDGGAVFIKQSGTFELNGGVIQNCSAGANGGAVNIYQDGRFTMTGGTIKSCDVDLGGLGKAIYGSNNKAVVTMTGGTFEDCGVFPYSFDEFTVTFDSDGGSAVSEQKLRNAPAIKPADPKKNGYDFAGWYLGDMQYTFDSNVAANITLKAKWTPTTAPTAITAATVENAKFDYQPGDAPQASATVAAADLDKYEIVYECWQQFENNEPVAAWYSDNGSHGTLPTITNFENGKHYVYSLMLQPKDGYSFSSETVITVNGQKVSAPFVGGSMYIPSIKTITPTKQTDDITSVDIENVKLNYQPGDAARPTAVRAGSEQDKYDILYESWGKRVKDADDTITTVAYWYSDDSRYSDGDARFNIFEKGGRYQYSIRLRAKDGYVFDSNLSSNNVTLNGQALPFGSWVNVLDDGRTCLITYGTETRPGQVVEAIRLDAVIEFDAGDKPRFSSGIVDPFVDTDHQRWDANDGSGYGITSSEFWNIRYNGKLITAFEDGKSYTYGVYFKISDLGMEEGYRFDKNTKLYINGTEITLTPDQIDVDDNGETIWLYNVLTMTPKPAKTWQKIDVIEIEGATVNFKDGDKPAFTGKTPENAPYKYQFECWETKDGAGVNSAEFFDKAYEKHITAFESGETYQYILYFKAEEGYYFTADTRIKINGTFYGYRLVNIDPDHDSSGRMYTFWAYTDLTMTPQASGQAPDYKITEGAGGSWTLGSDGTLKFSASGELSKLTGVKVDGALLAADKYTAAAEPTVITLKNDYLGTLSAGKHTLTVVYSDGECSAEFEIKAGPEAGGDRDKPDGEVKKPDNKETKPAKSPKTGDSVYMWTALLLVSFAATAAAIVRKRKKQAGR